MKQLSIDIKTVILYLIFVFLLSTVSLAQPKVHLGLTSAVNSTFVLDKGLSEDPRYSAKANYEWAPIGFTFGIDLSKSFGLQLESIKSAQGQIYEIIDVYDQVVGERNIDLNYLQFPLLLRFMSKGDGRTRFNFQMGPQLSFMQQGVETIEYLQSVQEIPAGGEIPAGATINPDGTYNVPALEPTEILSSVAENEIQKFKDKEVQLSMGFGLDIDVFRNFYLSTNVRASYSFTDMRNGDLINMIKNNDINGIFNRRANFIVGVQFGLHWMIGGTRFFKARDKKSSENIGEEVIR
jgi:hypothetical protein